MDTSKFVSARIAEVWRNMLYRPTEILDNPKVVYENPDFLYFGDIGNRYACTISIDHAPVSGSYEIINVNEDFGSTQIRIISGTESLIGDVFWTDSEELLSGNSFSVYEDASLEQEVENIKITTEVPTPTVKGWYGVEVDETNTDPAGAVTRIASDMTLHASLPIQSGMRRCVMKSDGSINYYLSANNSTLKEDGTGAKLDGTEGDVMVEIPEHWVLVTKEKTRLIVKLAMEEGALEGAQRVPLHYISAYQGVAVRGRNQHLRSVSGVGATGNLNIGEFRTAADHKNKNAKHCWSQMTYDYAVDLYWLFLVEYANRNSQAVVNNSLTPEGYRQGGLGMGCTYVDSINNYPAVTNGVTNSLGNNSGEISGVTPLSGSGTATVNSYRGIENPFGNLYTFYDGIVNIFGNIYRAADIADYKSFFYEKIIITTRDYVEGEVVVTPDKDGYLYYLCIAPSTVGDLLSDDTMFEPTNMATLGYVLDVEYAETIDACPMLSINNSNSPLGSLLAASNNEDEYTEGYCDDSAVSSSSLLCVYGGGYACRKVGDMSYFGLALVDAFSSVFDDADATAGSRLCYTA